MDKQELPALEVVAWLSELSERATTDKLMGRAWLEGPRSDAVKPLVRESDAVAALTAQAAEVARLTAEVEGLRKDAERYHWLRSRVPGGAYRIMGVIYSDGGAGVDAAIDAAMAAELGRQTNG